MRLLLGDSGNPPRENLFSDASPCPVCDTGHCSGYAGDSDPRAVFCGSPLHCGAAPIAAFRPTGVRLWTHTRYGRCGCGERHDRPHTGAGTMQPLAEPAPQRAERRPSAPVEPPPAPSIAILRGQELRTRPAVPFLLPGLVPLGGLVALYGEAGVCKTFLALHLSALLAAGGTWLGQALPPQGQVLYISAEGTGGLPSRYAAWCAHYHGGADVPDLLFILQPIYPTVDEMMQALAAAMQARACERPALTVIDTLARCYMGDENGSADMTAFVRALDRLRHQTGGAVLLVHHTGWGDTSRMRGSSVLRGALDAELQVTRDGLGAIKLRCTKQKDAQEAPPLFFRLEPVAGTESCVVLADGARTDQMPPPVPDKHERVLAALHDAGLAGATFGALRDATGITRDPALAATLRALQGQGLIARVVDAGSPRGRYYLTGAGERLAAPPDSAAPPPASGMAGAQPTGGQTMEEF
jgi:hypothetical protein